MLFEHGDYFVKFNYTYNFFIHASILPQDSTLYVCDCGKILMFAASLRKEPDGPQARYRVTVWDLWMTRAN